MKTIEVAAALVFRDGRLLITQRPAGGHLAGLWEFPGGKRESAESFEQALHRELMEELGIEVEVGGLVDSITHEYPEKSVHLRFFQCVWKRHEPQAIECADWLWIGRDDLEKFQFPAADARLLKKLQEPGFWPG